MIYFANGDVDFSSLNDASEFEQLPDGNYHVCLNSMELGESKNGKPMLKACFQVLSGDYAGQLIFANLILLNDNGSKNDSMFVHRCNEFLRGFGINKEAVKLTTLNNYAKLVDEIARTVQENSLTYGVTLSTEVPKKGNTVYHRCEVTSGPYQAQAQNTGGITF